MLLNVRPSVRPTVHPTDRPSDLFIRRKVDLGPGPIEPTGYKKTKNTILEYEYTKIGLSTLAPKKMKTRSK